MVDWEGLSIYTGLLIIIFVFGYFLWYVVNNSSLRSPTNLIAIPLEYDGSSSWLYSFTWDDPNRNPNSNSYQIVLSNSTSIETNSREWNPQTPFVNGTSYQLSVSVIKGKKTSVPTTIVFTPEDKGRVFPLPALSNLPVSDLSPISSYKSTATNNIVSCEVPTTLTSVGWYLKNMSDQEAILSYTYYTTNDCSETGYCFKKLIVQPKSEGSWNNNSTGKNYLLFPGLTLQCGTSFPQQIIPNNINPLTQYIYFLITPQGKGHVYIKSKFVLP